jgi:hypothetical protein
MSTRLINDLVIASLANSLVDYANTEGSPEALNALFPVLGLPDQSRDLSYAKQAVYLQLAADNFSTFEAAYPDHKDAEAFIPTGLDFSQANTLAKLTVPDSVQGLGYLHNACIQVEGNTDAPFNQTPLHEILTHYREKLPARLLAQIADAPGAAAFDQNVSWRQAAKDLQSLHHNGQDEYNLQEAMGAFTAQWGGINVGHKGGKQSTEIYGQDVILSMISQVEHPRDDGHFLVPQAGEKATQACWHDYVERYSVDTGVFLSSDIPEPDLGTVLRIQNALTQLTAHVAALPPGSVQGLSGALLSPVDEQTFKKRLDTWVDSHSRGISNHLRLLPGNGLFADELAYEVKAQTPSEKVYLVGAMDVVHFEAWPKASKMFSPLEAVSRRDDAFAFTDPEYAKAAMRSITQTMGVAFIECPVTPTQLNKLKVNGCLVGHPAITLIADEVSKIQQNYTEKLAPHVMAKVLYEGLNERLPSTLPSLRQQVSDACQNGWALTPKYVANQLVKEFPPEQREQLAYDLIGKARPVSLRDVHQPERHEDASLSRKR